MASLSVVAQTPGQQPVEEEAVVRRMYSNVRWSAERNTLVGANIRITREGEEVKGTYILFDGSEKGTPHYFSGTAKDSHIAFSVRAAGTTLRFSGRMTENELLGKMTVVRPDKTKEQMDFKARRMWRH